MDNIILKFQKNEINEHYVYMNLAKTIKDKNKKVLEKIADDELRHYHFFKKHSGVDVKPDKIKVFMLFLLGRIFGITFASKFMEKGEENAQGAYARLKTTVKNIDAVIKDEKKHENAILAMIEEEKLAYISSMVLGLNDAIVELTGALAGFTFALQRTKVIGAAGFITGIAAALSMAAAEYLSQKSENTGRSPLKAAFYTGFIYFIVVIILVAPYFLVNSYYFAMGLMLIGVLIVILFFAFFVSVVQDSSFKSIFWEMVFICLGVSVVAFLIGVAARKILNIQI